MATVSNNEFVANFHSLEGVTVGERRKNLFHLLNKTQQSLEVTPVEINFSDIQPKTPLEENFRVQTLIRFRKIPDLLQVLQGGNPILIGKVLKVSSWFIQEAFQNINGYHLVTQIFPNLSYNTKLKLLTNFSWHLLDTQKADEFFEAIKDAYGVYLASKMLPACSDTLILKSIDAYKFEVIPIYLLGIIRKYPSLTEEILEKLYKQNTKTKFASKYQNVFVHLMKYNITLFLALKKKYDPDFVLGFKATKSFVNKQKEVILEKPKTFSKFLRQERIGRSMKEDFKEFYCALLPGSVDSFQQNVEHHLLMLKHIPSDAQKLEMVLGAYQEAYGGDIWDHPSFITEKLIKLMKPEYREHFLKTHQRPENITENEWISFSKADQSIPLLKAKFSHASNVNERVALVASLVRTCAINRDKTALTEVIKFMIQHRNDPVVVQQQFVITLLDWFKSVKFEEEQWTLLVEYLRFYKLHVGFCSSLSEKYIFYCLENNQPVKDLLVEWIKEDCRQFNICSKNPKYEKSCLLMFGEIIPTIHKDDVLQDAVVDYLNSVVSYNNNHPRDKISLFISDTAISCLMLKLEKSQYCYQEQRVALECLISDFKKSQESNMLLVFLKTHPCCNVPRLIDFLLSNQPLILRDNIVPIIEFVLKVYKAPTYFRKWVHNYTHTENMSTEIFNTCLKIVKEDTSFKKKRSAMGILSTANAHEDFLNLAAMYYPTELSPNIESPEDQNTHKLQRLILICLKNVVPPARAFDCIFKYCKGDYLKYAQISLHSIFYNAEENKLLPFIELLGQQAVSVRKHAILFAFQILNKADAYRLITHFVNTDKNSSIRQHLLRACFNFFTRSPDDRSWDLTQQCVKNLDSSDEQAFEILTRCKKVPAKYFERYLSFVWSILEDFSNPSDVIIASKTNILQAVTMPIVPLVPKEFYLTVIEKYLFQTKELSEFQKAVQSFVCTYIIYYENEVAHPELMNPIFAILRKYINSTWYTLDTNVIGRKMISNFVNQFCSDFMSKKCVSSNVIRSFVVLWDDNIKPQEAFDEHLHMQFTLMYVEHLDDKTALLHIGEKLAHLCNSLHKEQTLVMSIFCESLGSFKDKFLSINSNTNAHEKELILIESIVKTSISNPCLTLVVNLLPNHSLMGSKTETMYNQILDSIIKYGTTAVKIRLHHYLRNKQIST